MRSRNRRAKRFRGCRGPAGHSIRGLSFRRRRAVVRRHWSCLTSIPVNTGSCTSRHQHPPTFSRVLTSSLAGCGRGDAFIWAAHRETGVRVPISIRHLHDLHSRAARQISPFAEPPRSAAFTRPFSRGSATTDTSPSG